MTTFLDRFEANSGPKAVFASAISAVAHRIPDLAL
jgi:hypothetical protein